MWHKKIDAVTDDKVWHKKIDAVTDDKVWHKVWPRIVGINLRIQC